jgi:hypothetical protein
MESQILKGEKYLYRVLGTIVLLQVITNISESVPLLFSVPRLSFLFILFYFLIEGHIWSKWLLAIYTFSVGIGGIGAGFLLIRLRDTFPENMAMGIMAIIIGIFYMLSMFVFFFSKEIKFYIKEKSSDRKKVNARTHISNILLFIGVAIIICFETTLLPSAVQNVFLNPSLTKRIFGLIFLLPVKIPYYAIPGLVVILISRLIDSEKQGEKV